MLHDVSETFPTTQTMSDRDRTMLHNVSETSPTTQTMAADASFHSLYKLSNLNLNTAKSN